MIPSGTLPAPMTTFQTIASLAVGLLMLALVAIWRLALSVLLQAERMLGGKLEGAASARTGDTPLVSVPLSAIEAKMEGVRAAVLGMLKGLGFAGRLAAGVMRRRKDEMLAEVKAACAARGLQEIPERELVSISLQVVLSTVIRGIRARCHLLLALAEIALAAILAAFLLLTW